MKGVTKNVTRGVLAGGVAYAISKFALGYEGDIVVNNMTLDSNLGFGIAAGVGSAMGGVIVDTAINNMEGKSKTAAIENRVLKPAVVGASTYLFARMMGDVESVLPVVAIGASSEVAAAYVQDTYNNNSSSQVTAPPSNEYV